MTDDVARLLQHIARQYTGPQEIKEVERDDPNISAEDLGKQRDRARRDEERRVQELEDAFRRGLARSYRAREAGGDAISLDDRDPEQNRMADALVHFLVGPGIATSRTRETTPRHYIYTIWVDWPKLFTVAREARVDLKASIQHVPEH